MSLGIGGATPFAQPVTGHPTAMNHCYRPISGYDAGRQTKLKCPSCGVWGLKGARCQLCTAVIPAPRRAVSPSLRQHNALCQPTGSKVPGASLSGGQFVASALSARAFGAPVDVNRDRSGGPAPCGGAAVTSSSYSPSSRHAFLAAPSPVSSPGAASSVVDGGVDGLFAPAAMGGYSSATMMPSSSSTIPPSVVAMQRAALARMLGPPPSASLPRSGSAASSATTMPYSRALAPGQQQATTTLAGQPSPYAVHGALMAQNTLLNRGAYASTAASVVATSRSRSPSASVRSASVTSSSLAAFSARSVSPGVSISGATMRSVGGGVASVKKVRCTYCGSWCLPGRTCALCRSAAPVS